MFVETAIDKFLTPNPDRDYSICLSEDQKHVIYKYNRENSIEFKIQKIVPPAKIYLKQSKFDNEFVTLYRFYLPKGEDEKTNLIKVLKMLSLVELK